MKKVTIKKVIEKIKNDFLNKKEMTDLPKYPLLKGSFGRIIFLANYYNKIEQNDVIIDSIMGYIEDAFQNIPELEDCSLAGLSSIGWGLIYLCENSILPFSSVQNDIDKIAKIVNNSLETDLQSNNFDLFYGYIGKLLFLIAYSKYNKSFNVTELLVKAKNVLKKHAKKDKDGFLSWGAHEDEGGDYYFNLGLSHGIPGIICFLIHISSYLSSSDRDEVKSIVNLSTKWMINLKNIFTRINSRSIYPPIYQENNTILEGEMGLSWCYGDLGIGLCLIKAGKYLQDMRVLEEGVVILKECAKTSINESKIKNTIGDIDCQFCHGLIGVIHILNRAYETTKDKFLLDRLSYWEDLFLQNINLDEEFASLKSAYIDKQGEVCWISSSGVLNGVSGIGLVLCDMIEGKSEERYSNNLGWDTIFFTNFNDIKNV